LILLLARLAVVPSAKAGQEEDRAAALVAEVRGVAVAVAVAVVGAVVVAEVAAVADVRRAEE
jgi:hypothetical protein